MPAPKKNSNKADKTISKKVASTKVKAEKKSSVKKQITEIESSNPENLSNSGVIAAPEQLNINHLLTQALSRYKNDAILQDKKDKLGELQHLSNIVEEYLSCFTLIGYTMQGEKVCLFNAATSKDEAALVDLLRATFLEIVNNRP